ncbi:hypothetical protein [Nesterenkonia haasae]|uniref:hypothetical protein n=1 Tax=Nesterenkonia haasae TaxID=2587813 RepID=UPI00192EDC03|nr:hypothetical protein [Nesterenkonia haasae]
MQYRTFGRTGVQISTLALGAMNTGRIGRTRQKYVESIISSAVGSRRDDPWTISLRSSSMEGQRRLLSTFFCREAISRSVVHELDTLARTQPTFRLPT